MKGWREAFIAAPEELRSVQNPLQPLSAYLGTLGMTGMTAWAGLTMVEVKTGDVINPQMRVSPHSDGLMRWIRYSP